MSVSLDDIWSEPLETSPSPPRPNGRVAGDAGDDDDDNDIFRPSKRRRSTLFLEDPDEEDNRERARSTTHSTQLAKGSRPDINSLFDDLDKPAGAPRASAKASKPFDLAAYRREAQLRAEKEVPASSLPRYAVQSSSPPRDGMGGDGRDSVFGARKGDGTKEKKSVAKLDETRLLGKDGLPALIQLCKDFTPKGKGHELADLNRLFSTYQFWAHKMFPKTQFSDTVNRVEKLCHSKRMHVALSVWKDEVKRTVYGANIGGDEDVEMRSDKADESGDEEGRDRDVFGPRTANTSSQAASSSHASSEAFELPISRPPSSASEHDATVDDEDPFDIDALLAAEEDMSRAAAAITVKTKGGAAGRDFTFDDDESEMWAELHAEEPRNAPRATVIETEAVPRAVPGASKTCSGAEEDEDMWEILDGIEKEQQTKADAPSAQSRAGSTTTLSTADVPKVTTSAVTADDWEDMYV